MRRAIVATIGSPRPVPSPGRAVAAAEALEGVLEQVVRKARAVVGHVQLHLPAADARREPDLAPPWRARSPRGCRAPAPPGRGRPSTSRAPRRSRCAPGPPPPRRPGQPPPTSARGVERLAAHGGGRVRAREHQKVVGEPRDPAASCSRTRAPPAARRAASPRRASWTSAAARPGASSARDSRRQQPALALERGVQPGQQPLSVRPSASISSLCAARAAARRCSSR